jgi:hypothetical protein
MKLLKKMKWLMLLVLFPLNGSIWVEKDYKFHTVFVYNFTKYIEWPVNIDHMNIGVVNGSDDLMRTFQRMADLKSTHNQKFYIRNIRSVAEASDCHILFIPENQSNKLTQFTENSSGKPVLIITEQSGLIKKGSLINFITIDGKLNIELNRSAFEKAGLKVSGQLLGLAILV